MEDLRQSIIIQEAVTDKLIGASIVQKYPKIVSLKSMFEKLFPKKLKIQTPEEIAKTLRAVMKAEQDE